MSAETDAADRAVEVTDLTERLEMAEGILRRLLKSQTIRLPDDETSAALSGLAEPDWYVAEGHHYVAVTKEQFSYLRSLTSE